MTSKNKRKSELKTLKNMPSIWLGDLAKDTILEKYIGKSLTPKDEIKDEAIKWIKHFENDFRTMTWKDFMEFHNITEEDLKNDTQ